MNETKLNRRLKRHYRKYVDGKIIYDINNIDYDQSFNDSSVSEKNTSNNNTKNLLDISKNEKIKPVVENKQKAIEKTLYNLSEMINPDEEVIADIIYKELKNKSVIGKEDIKSAVKNSKHYRATEESKSFGVTSDRERMKLVVEDVYTQLENQQIKNNQEKTKDVKVTQKENKPKNKNQNISKKDENKKVKKPETKKSKNENTDNFKDLIDDDSEEEDLDLSDDSDDLGLKF
jgi:hypothetical protein